MFVEVIQAVVEEPMEEEAENSPVALLDPVDIVVSIPATRFLYSLLVTRWWGGEGKSSAMSSLHIISILTG